MKRISFTLLTLIMTFILFQCPGPDQPEIPGLSDTIILDIPETMTGTAGGSRSFRATQGTIDTIDGFYNYVRHQIWYAHLCAQFLKELVAALEAEDIFDSTEGFEAALSGDNAGDVVKWTKNSETDYRQNQHLYQQS